MFRDGDFGDQSNFQGAGYYVPYIPTGADDPNMNYVADNALSYEQIASYVEAAGLGGYAGGYSPKNTGSQPWISRMDLRLEQEIPGFGDGHTGSIYVDVKNVLNLLNNEWGQVLQKEYNNQSVVDFGGLDDQGRYIYEEPFGGFDDRNWDEHVIEDSIWSLKVGVRYTF